jgi:hypothetical protein
MSVNIIIKQVTANDFQIKQDILLFILAFQANGINKTFVEEQRSHIYRVWYNNTLCWDRSNWPGKIKIKTLMLITLQVFLPPILQESYFALFGQRSGKSVFCTQQGNIFHTSRNDTQRPIRRAGLRNISLCNET